MSSTEIVVVGNEVLLGVVQDTNSGYLCRVIRARGGNVRRIVTVQDDVTEIAVEIRRSLDRGADLVFTCGGLGPTDDDRTLAGVATAAGVDLVLNESARAFVESRYDELARQGLIARREMNEARLRMATIPKGAMIVANLVGTAPAVILQLGARHVVCLPGVPDELKGIVEGPLQDFLEKQCGQGCYRETQLIARCGDESVLAPLLREVAARNPDAYVKSRARIFRGDAKFRILIAVTAVNPVDAERRLLEVRQELAAGLERANIPILNDDAPG